MKPNEIPWKPTKFKLSRQLAEALAKDFLQGMGYFEISKKYGVSETSIRRTITRIYGETGMTRKMRKTKRQIQSQESISSPKLGPDDKIKILEQELKRRDKKIHAMEYQLEVLGDFLGKDFGLPKKK